MNIVIVGHVCIDHNISEHARYTSPGSPAMFMQKIFRQLPGASVTIVSHYGKDYLPYLTGISMHPTKPFGEKTLVYENVSHGNFRSQKALHRDLATPVVIDEKLKKLLSEADVIIFGPILPNFSVEYVKKVISVANPKAIKLLMPQGYFRSFDPENNVFFRTFVEAEKLLDTVDLVTVSREDYPDIEKMSLAWTKKRNATVILTEGDQGASIIAAGKKTHLPTERVPLKNIVDSVGSGDIFSAGFVYEYAKTGDLKKAVNFANKLAGICLAFTPDRIRFDYKKISS